MYAVQRDIERQPPGEEDLDPVEFTDEELQCMQDGMPWMPEPEPFEDFLDIEFKAKKLEKIPAIYPSQFTEFAFRMPKADGTGYENFTFEGRRHMKRPYNTPAKRVLLFCGRQVEKSTLLGNIILTYSCLIPGYKTLYVSPSATQTKTFSSDRIKEPIETSPILKAYTTNALSMNILEKQFVNRAKITMRYAFLNADRCAIGSTRVHFTDGAVATLKEIYDDPASYVGRWVWSADPEALKPVPAQLEDVVYQGRRPVFTVRLEAGAETTCTDNQPLLTWNGWRQVKDLHVGDYVAVPRRSAHGSGNEIPIEEYRLVGYLLGDGSLTTFNGVAFFNGCPVVMSDFQRCAQALGAKLGKLQDSNRAHWVESETKRQGIFGGIQGYKKRLRELGLIGQNHATKRVPSAFFTGNEAQVAALLGAIYATDGWASLSSRRQFEIGYASNSLGLLHDLKVLLLRFGVVSWVSRQKKPSTAGAQGAYVLSIRSAASVKAFCEQIPVLGKEEAFASVYQAACLVSRKKDDADRIPLSYADLRAYLKRAHGLTTHSAWMKHKIQLRPGNTKTSIGRRVLAEIARKLEDAYLTSLAESELGWARITSIDPAGEAQTYDLTVSETENYLVDGMFIHNTRGIPAWLLALDELQDIIADNIPVIEQCTSHAPEQMRRFIYAGTPKGLDNPIEYYRSGVSKDGKPMSTQGEWVVPCDKHGGETGMHWNVLSEKNIGRKGLICEKCGSLINPMHEKAQWAQMVADGIFESYRIPQLMVPWRPWDEILLDYSRYSRDKFYNEVLGISYDSGLRPLTMGQIKDCCNPQLTMHPDAVERTRKMLLNGTEVFAGIDWGCHDEETRILTETGFKYFRDLKADDKVAQWDPDTREMTFVTPKVRTIRDWDRPLLHFKTRDGLDLMVTDTHRMRVNPLPSGKWVTEAAGETVKRGGNVKFVGSVTWRGEEVPYFTLPGLPISPGYSGSDERTFSMDDWLELLGYLVTEGGLCFDGDRPSCLKMSQRRTVNAHVCERIQACLDRMQIPYKAFLNPKTGDVNWTIYGKQYWHWYAENVGRTGAEKRIPREFLRLSQRQLWILWRAMVGGDGSIDPRPGNTGGSFYSTSKGLCEDFQEICIRLGLRAVLRPHKEANGNRKAQWRVSWSEGRDYQLNTPSSSVERVPYNGKVYCCSVPTGYIVTERNGCISYQGNTGENSYTVMSLGYYEGHRFRIFWIHRFTGEDVDPQIQISKIVAIIRAFNCRIIAADYGGGFASNNVLVREFGPARFHKFQYQARVKKKVYRDDRLARFLVHRTEVMSDIFAAIKRGQFEFPRWEEFHQPYAQDMLNIFSEYNETLRMIQYQHRPDRPDDSFHSILYCFLGSMIVRPRPDIIAPKREYENVGPQYSGYTGPLYQG
jgi:intein/homing endonuclease